LVEARLRRKSPNSEVKPDEDAESIATAADSILDLLELCQWRLRVRKAAWKIRARKYFQLLNPEISLAEKEAQGRIEEATYPLDFHRGLILMGVSGDSRGKREAAFDEFLREWIVGSARADHHQSRHWNGENGGTEFVPPTEEYIVAEIEKQKREGWKDRYMLSLARDAWQRLKRVRIKDHRSRGGKASGKARQKQADKGD
jgi:hypothetical protein